MEMFALEWANLILRWFHILAGIAWIGTSFHFIRLDQQLLPSPEKEKNEEAVGQAWLVHSGGFYRVTKYPQLPKAMISHLHWFKWEAYGTWLSGMALLSVMYYIGAKHGLIDEQVADLTQWQAIGIGLGSLLIGWLAYDGLCKSFLATNPYLFAILSWIGVLIAAFAFTRIFTSQGAYIHVGAMIGTIMAGNVFMVIIPAQKKLLAAVTNGQSPDLTLTAKAKARSIHNYYATLPVLFIMISNHYPMVYMSEYNWLVLPLIIAAITSTQYILNPKHKSLTQPAKSHS